MIITVTFPDSHQETFLSAQQASYSIEISSVTILNAIKIGKKKIIRRRDKAEFQVEAKDYPRIKIKKKMEKYLFFSTLREAEEYFSLSRNTLQSKIAKNDPNIVSRKGERQVLLSLPQELLGQKLSRKKHFPKRF